MSIVFVMSQVLAVGFMRQEAHNHRQLASLGEDFFLDEREGHGDQNETDQ
jgi:hypothetical protein